MEGRRVRRFGIERGRRRRERQLHSPLSNTFSCFFCDFKFTSLNQSLFHFGTKHAAIFRPWFSIGVGFGLTALLAVSLILLWELGRALHLLPQSSFGDHSTALLFGFSHFPSSSVYTYSISFSDATFLLVSTLISVCFHEFGHALAAASEGIQMEYIAIFIAVLFPGALVAFNSDLLQALPHFTALRVYCAGIWHNAVSCAFCGLLLFLLPFILFPFYKHGQSPMVLAVPSSSSLSGYLSPGDVIVSLDGMHVHSTQEWMDMATLINELAFKDINNSRYIENIGSVNSRKGYCVPNSVLDKSITIQSEESQFACPDDLAAFVKAPCFPTSMTADGPPNRVEQTHCLNAEDVVKLDKCGNGWVTAGTNGSGCTCSQGESCLSPIQAPGMLWIEVKYSSPYSKECLELKSDLLSDTRASEVLESKCGGTFVFVGDVIWMTRSVRLTAYQPRWPFLAIYLPNILERFCACTFHISLTLALLNSLPVYFLDGESLLETTLCHFTLLSPNKRKKLLRMCLVGGTLISFLAIIRIVLKFL
ncbi:hypothetical protein UlMin_020067 [Ulmus minor]